MFAFPSAASNGPARRTAWRMLAIVFFGNSLIAVVLWLGGIDEKLGDLWLTSQCIGLSIMFCEHAVLRFSDNGQAALWSTMLAVVIGAGVGFAGAYLLGFFPNLDAASDWPIVLRIGAMVLTIGLIAHAFYQNVQRLNELKIAQQAAQLRELTLRQDSTLAELKRLQAQIEPHFLFNTLANLHSLIGSDDALARRLLERLNDYLRASLDHSRSSGGTLGDECRLLAAYLDIQALRMGQRLSWSIDVADEFKALPLAPMLLQPLVENAVRHGIEPRVGPGRIAVSARRENQRLCLAVKDDGQGLTASALRPATGRSAGVGLRNVRERLAALYGGQAELVLRDNASGSEYTPRATGVSAELWIPLPDHAH